MALYVCSLARLSAVACPVEHRTSLLLTNTYAWLELVGWVQDHVFVLVQLAQYLRGLTIALADLYLTQMQNSVDDREYRPLILSAKQGTCWNLHFVFSVPRNRSPKFQENVSVARPFMNLRIAKDNLVPLLPFG